MHDKIWVLPEEYWRGETELLWKEDVPVAPRSSTDIICSVLWLNPGLSIENSVKSHIASIRIKF